MDPTQKTIERHAEEISDIKKALSPLEAQIKVLCNEKGHIVTRMDKLDAKMDKVSEIVQSTRDTINGLVNEATTKEKMIMQINSRLRMIAAIFAVATAVIGYFSYESGLHKPIPTYHQQSK